MTASKTTLTYGVFCRTAAHQFVVVSTTRKFSPRIVGTRDVQFFISDLGGFFNLGGIKWVEPRAKGAWVTYDYDGERWHVRWDGEQWETVSRSRRAVP